ncbi:MAG: MgtC/SapB family protein [Bdellovibrionales bacterium]|nr:MgtC/SapB family protein [Bdellovibrionales bacterium]
MLHFLTELTLKDMSEFGHGSFLQLAQFFLPKIFFSVLCGGLIGLERELKSKPAGIKTNILICLGATLYSAISGLISNLNLETGQIGDPGRVAAQIVSGIGFLGGGTIIQSRGTIFGLTTAATMWVVAAVGLAIGIGRSDVGVLISVTVVVVLITTSWFEDRILGRSLKFSLEILADDPDGRVREAINHALARNDLVMDDFDLAHQGVHSRIILKYNGHRTSHKKFILDLWSTPGIREVKSR